MRASDKNDVKALAYFVKQNAGFIDPLVQLVQIKLAKNSVD